MSEETTQKHIRGKFELSDDDACSIEVEGAPIARVYDSLWFPCSDPEDAERLDAEAAATARLFAAAPDLLTALKGVVRVADRATVEFDAARAAIAKAEGNSNV